MRKSCSDRLPRTRWSFVILPALGVALALFSTPWGIGLSPDSIVYLTAARHWLNGQGISQLSNAGQLLPLLHFPPLFSVLLAICATRLDLLESARWMNALLLGMNILFIEGMIYRMTRECRPALLGALLAVTSLTFLAIHTMAWSEPLFIFLGSSTLLFVVMYLESSQPVFLIASALMASLTMLTRYTGGAFTLTSFACLVLFMKGSREKVVSAAAFGLVSSLPLGLWLIHNWVLTGAATDRVFAVHWIRLADLQTAASTISDWILPSPTPILIRTIVLLLLAASLVIGLIRGQQRPRRRAMTSSDLWLFALLIFIFVYGLGLVISISFFDASTSLDDRMLSPIFIAVLILGVYIAWRWFRVVQGSRAKQTVLVGVIALFVLSGLIRTAFWVAIARSDGQGFASRVWRQSPLVQVAATIPESDKVFTNGPDVIYFLTGRRAALIPAKVDSMTRQPNVAYPAQVSAMRQELGKGAVLIDFRAINWRWYLPSEKELVHQLMVCPIFADSDGVVYQTVCGNGRHGAFLLIDYSNLQSP